MFFTAWQKGLRKLARSARRPRKPASRPRARPWLELLEDRYVPSYVFTDLGAVAPAAINNAGIVVGSLNGHAVVEQNGVVTDLGTLGGASSSANDINQLGQVVGSAYTPDGYGHAFLVTPEDTDGDGQPDLWFRDNDLNGINDLMTDLGTLGGTISSASAINDAGQVAGLSSTASNALSHAFLWTSAGGMQDLGTFGGTSARAAAINNSGQVVGTAYTQIPRYGIVVYHAFSWDSVGGGRLLGQLPGDNASTATGINDAGQVVGISGTVDSLGRFLVHDAYLYQGGSFTGLGMSIPSSQWTTRLSINNNAQVVGSSSLWQSGVSGDLNSVLDPAQGWTVSTTADINDAGQIVGQGTHNGASPSNFLLPVGTTPPPSLSVSGASVTEGDDGSVTATFTVTRSGPLDRTVTVDFTTADGTATAGKDYVAVSGTLTFIPGETTKTISVSVLGDLVDEYDETFSVRLSNASGAFLASTQAVGTILDNDPPPQITISDVTLKEGKANTYTYFVFTVSLSAPSEKPVSVNFGTADGTATGGGKQADYYSQGGAFTFNPGETTKTISIAVIGDSRKEADETFFVNLSGAINASILDGQGLGTILNDD